MAQIKLNIGNYLTKDNFLDYAFPIGTILVRNDSTSPASIYGGEWEQLKDKFLLGAGDSYSLDDEGGEVTHTLSVDEMPKHQHGMQQPSNIAQAGSHIGSELTVNYTEGSTIYKYTAYAGGSQAHNNMPPYIAKYIWQRVA